jgi:hypothetical protein
MKDLADDVSQKPRLDAMLTKMKTSQENWADKQELKSEKPLPLKIDLSKIPKEKGKEKKKS